MLLAEVIAAAAPLLLKLLNEVVDERTPEEAALRAEYLLDKAAALRLTADDLAEIDRHRAAIRLARRSRMLEVKARRLAGRSKD